MMSGSELIAFLQIVLIDISLAGDNAIVVGMAAAGLPVAKRHHAVIAGILVATILRIVFAIFAIQILHITGLLAAGGLILLWVAWKMFEEIRHEITFRSFRRKPESSTTPAKAGRTYISHTPRRRAALDADFHRHDERKKSPAKTLSSAIMQIVIADVSMSLDNVLAVAGVARDHIWVLVIGLAISVLLMGAAASFIARLTSRYRWIAYVALVTVLYTAASMIWDGSKEIWPNLI